MVRIRRHWRMLGATAPGRAGRLLEASMVRCLGSLGLLCVCVSFSAAAGQDRVASETAFPESISGVVNTSAGHARISRPYESPPPGSVFTERSMTSSGFPMISSRRMVAPAFPLADPNDPAARPYAAAAGASSTNPFVTPLDVSGVDLFTVMPHFTYLDYGSGSVKHIGEQSGVYGYASTTINMLELGIDDTRIKFRNGFDFNQQDVTAVLSDYGIPNIRLRAGVHYINNNDPLTNGGIIGFGGAHYFIKDRWEAGVDTYASRYSDYAPPVTITQITPHLGLQLTSWIRGDLRGYYIHADEDVGLGKRDFYSLEGRITHEVGRLTIAGFGWGGEQTFAVRNDGFVVFNLNEKHTGGYGAEVGVKIMPHTKFTARVSNELFSDFALQQKTHLLYATVLLMHSF